jgi:hypothetical protein
MAADKAAHLHRTTHPRHRAFIALANAVIILRRLLAEAWLTHRWDTRPARRP